MDRNGDRVQTCHIESEHFPGLRWDTEGQDVTQEDWIAYVALDQSLQIDPDRSAAADPRVASGAKEPSHAFWIDWPDREAGVREAWTWLERGNLVATDADVRFRQKLFLIADGLGACLMGENGEVYNSGGEPEGRLSRSGLVGAKKPWWKFW